MREQHIAKRLGRAALIVVGCAVGAGWYVWSQMDPWALQPLPPTKLIGIYPSQTLDYTWLDTGSLRIWPSGQAAISVDMAPRKLTALPVVERVVAGEPAGGVGHGSTSLALPDGSVLRGWSGHPGWLPVRTVPCAHRPADLDARGTWRWDASKRLFVSYATEGGAGTVELDPAASRVRFTPGAVPTAALLHAGVGPDGDLYYVVSHSMMHVPDAHVELNAMNPRTGATRAVGKWELPGKPQVESVVLSPRGDEVACLAYHIARPAGPLARWWFRVRNRFQRPRVAATSVVWVCRLNGTNPRLVGRLTSNEKGDKAYTGVRWSPDGTQLALRAIPVGGTNVRFYSVRVPR